MERMKNILILDDNTDFLAALSARLCTYLKDCNIMTASDGVRGQEILRSERIDLVLTDLAMPIMNGYMLIEHTKKLYPTIPVCAMTANCSPQIKGRLRSMGVADWIEKPFQVEQLARMISRELNLGPQLNA